MLGNFPRITISALKGGSGKTIISLGLAVAWRKRGIRVAPFKKGPDFIDAGWLSFASDSTCHNLDPFMMTKSQMAQSFALNSSGSDISIIEGNRGLYDGFDLDGCCSTAELGKLLKSPVVIIVDVTMATRTIAALIMGCQKFDPDLNITGIILNRVAGLRQESLIRNSIDRYCGLPVLGSVPKLKGDLFPERHMGLVPRQERAQAEKAIAWARSTVEQNIDIDALFDISQKAEPLETVIDQNEKSRPANSDKKRPRIGFIMDRAFWFYYPENFDRLRAQGAELVEISAINDSSITNLDALYIGGGFPETQAEALANNKNFREALKVLIEKGLPVYAECGGLIYLGENLIMGERKYPMVGTLPIDFLFEKKPQGHGYTILEVEHGNPYYPVGEELKGHEFHYSRPLINHPEKIHTVFRVRRGHGLDGKKDGIVKKNLLATYTHLHALGCPIWAQSLCRAARSTKIAG